MGEEVEDKLSPEESRAFAGLRREATPPASLEERVVGSLKEAGLIRPRRASLMGAPAVAAAVAASLALFVLGVAAGARLFAEPGEKAQAPEFMLVLRALPAREEGTREDEMRRVREYSAWAGELRRSGLLVGGEKLEDDARVLRDVGGRVAVSEGHAQVPGESIAGYFLIQARDYQHAVTIAEGCPHVRHGGSIEVRRIARL
ncbi:MAG TPA: YciI family protein [Pyrinomonadaceae bacterium]|jgi:hypothetical protein|nr:YciI family protein [Pyrinomonadaceae bacterium]